MKREDKLALDRYLEKLEFAKKAGSSFANETKEERRQAIELCQKDPVEMVKRYFPHYANSESADFQKQWALMVEKNKSFRGFCQWGRALAKSVWNNIFIPFWLWLRGEPVYFVVIGTSEDRARQLLEDLQAEFEANPRIIGDFSEQQILGSWEAGFFKTKGGFIGQSLGMGQSVRGLRVKNTRPTHIVCDDLETKDINKNPKRQNEIASWIERDLIPTMDGKSRRFVQANNRFAPIMIQTILQERHPKWVVHQVNAFDPITFAPTWYQKYDQDYFYQMIYGDDGVGELVANAEYNNTPYVEGAIFKDEQFQWIELPDLTQFEYIIAHWDIAYAGTKTSDYNAIVIMGLKDKKFYVIDTYCRQTKMREAVAWMCQYQRLLPMGVVVHWQYESQFWNDEVQRILNEVQKEFNVCLNIIKRNLDRTKKIDRIMTLQPYYQNGRIFFNKELKGSVDMQSGIAQLKGIEPSYKTHDDWADAHQICISDLEKHTPSNAFKWVVGKFKKGGRW